LAGKENLFMVLRAAEGVQNVDNGEEKMRTIGSMVVALGIMSAGASVAAAAPADGAAIARLEEQVNTAVAVKTITAVKTKKPKTRTTRTPTSQPPREPSQSY
jgi:hypothetical protein